MTTPTTAAALRRALAAVARLGGGGCGRGGVGGAGAPGRAPLARLLLAPPTPPAAWPRSPPSPLASHTASRPLTTTSRSNTAARAASGDDASSSAAAASASDSSAVPEIVRDPPPKCAADIVKRITKDDVTIAFARSGGAGGQNVNKVNTKVDMRLGLDAAWLPADVAAVLARTEKKRINKEGALVVTSTKTRSQADNVEDALAKLQAILDAAAETLVPVEVDPAKAKQVEKQIRVANENRLQGKKMKSDKKKERRAKIEW